MPNTPQQPVEIESQLKKSGSVKLSAAGLGVITFDPDNARQRWEVRQVVVTTNQPATATTVPVCTLALNTDSFTTMSAGNQRGASWNGNQETFTGLEHVGPADFLSVLFTPPAGASGAPLSGVIATAVVTGSKFTRRA
jgi:hypothetical protein